MASLAYSFRSPSSPRQQSQDHRATTPSTSSEKISNTKQKPSSPGKKKKKTHRQTLSSTTQEYPFAPSSIRSSSEQAPLLGGGFSFNADGNSNNAAYDAVHSRNDPEGMGSKTFRGGISKVKATIIAANFLMDYEAGRPPTLPSQFESITFTQLQLYTVRFSWAWRFFGVSSAMAALFLAHNQNAFFTALLHTYAIILFFGEISMREQLSGSDPEVLKTHSDHKMVKLLVAFLIILGLESWTWLLVISDDPEKTYPTMISSLFKPIVFFYVSDRARDALEALLRIGKVVTRVIMIEVFLILTFAAVACRMFHSFSSFENLSTSWLSLFELSTTVVNPSLWMPMYQSNPWSALFFIGFIVTSVFYLHSLVLSVVFQTYVQAASEIHLRSVSDRESAIQLAFLALSKDDGSELISTSSIRRVLQIVRPHYSHHKVSMI